MTKDREGGSSVKTNKTTKKHSSSTKSLDGFLKKQNDMVSGLKVALHNSVAEKQQIKFAAMEKNKCIQELQKSIEERDSQIQKLNSELSAAKDENTKTLQDFYLFKEKFFELETHYDNECRKQTQKIEELKQQLENQKSQDNHHITELSNYCEELKKQLHEQKQTYAQLGFDYSELTDKCEKNKQEFVRQQKNFENYKKQVEVEKNAYDVKMNNDMAELRQDFLHKEEHMALQIEKLKYQLQEKEELISQCVKDKEIMEEEKNHKIQELNYKINQIEKVFVQPTKTVNPMVSIPSTPLDTANDQQTTKMSSNVAITKPQQRQKLPALITENKSSSGDSSDSNDTRIPETPSRLRSKKTLRPAQQNTRNANLSNINTHVSGRKREYFPEPELLRNPSPPRRDSMFSMTSSGDADDDDIKLCIPQWGPKSYVADTETDASEGFRKQKRSKK